MFVSAMLDWFLCGCAFGIELEARAVFAVFMHCSSSAAGLNSLCRVAVKFCGGR